MRLWWGILALLAMEIGLLAWTWQRWADPMVDFGREMAVAHGVADGKLLYRDLAYFNGPLSPAINSLWVKLFGRSILALAIPNAVMLGLLTIGVYRLIARAHGPAVATLSGAVLLSCFAVSQQLPLGNYNFLCPYSHELPHGLLLSVGMMLLLDRRLRGGPAWTSGAAGMLAGLALLTKAEVSLAVLAALGAFAYLGSRLGTITRRDAAWLAAGAAIPLAVCAAAFWSPERPELMTHALAGTWRALFQSRVKEMYFYRHLMGLDRPWIRLFEMLRGGASIGLLVLSLICLDAAIRSRSVRFGVLAAAAFSARLAVAGRLMPYVLDGPGLPLLVLILGGMYAHRARGPEGAATLAPMVLLSAFAAAFLAKMGLNCTLSNYGFALALPAGMVSVAGLTGLVPAMIKGRAGGESGDVFARMAAVVFSVECLFYIKVTSAFLVMLTYPIGEGPNRLYGFAPGSDTDRIVKRNLLSGPEINQTIASLQALAPSGATMVSLPEGAMLNIQSGIPNPTPFVTFLPPELEIFGEGAFVEAFERTPPEFIVWIHRDLVEYGVPPFGQGGNGERLAGFVRDRYTLIEEIRDNRPAGEWGVRLFRRARK